MAKRAWKWEEDGMTVVRSIARSAPGCHEGCGVKLYVKDGKLVKVEGDSEYPLNNGGLCPRCLSIKEVVYHPDRIKFPLKRAGERGEGRWTRITWDEAYDTVADKFASIKKNYGPESVIFCSGTGREAFPSLRMLGSSYGSPNIISFGPLHGNACFFPKIAMMGILLGGFLITDCAQSFALRYNHPGWKLPECIIIWGNEPLASNPDSFMGHWIVDCLKRGSKLIVIDPRKTWLASRADIWMQIRPGTDAALALAMLNIIIGEKLYDENFINKWTFGFEKLRERVREYTPLKVSEITWIPEEKIISAARIYAESKPAAIQWGVALDHSRECITSTQAVIALWAVTGNIDVPGGNVFTGKLPGDWPPPVGVDPALSEKQRNKKIGIGKYPLLDIMGLVPGESLIDQMISGEPYPIKASWIQGTNTFTGSTADPRRTYKAFKNLEINVDVELFMNPTSMAFADIVLPVATYPERDGIYIPLGCTTCLGAINKAIEPLGESKAEIQIDFEMGKRLNPSTWPWKDVNHMYDDMLKPVGMTFNDLREEDHIFSYFEYKKYEKGLLRPDGKQGFETPSGKVELYSNILEKCGLDPLPYFEEPPESPVSTPEIASEYPLILTTGARIAAFFCSEHRQVPSLRKMNPDPLLEMHPETALKLGISNGDWVYIENRYGRCKQKVTLTDGIHPGVVNAQHAWWFPEKEGVEPVLYGVWESNINLLLPSGWTGKSGFGYPFKCQMCRVYKTENPQDG